MKKHRLTLFIFSLLIMSMVPEYGYTEYKGGQSAKKPVQRFKQDEILVKFKKGVSVAAKMSIHRKHGSKKIKDLVKLSVHLVKLKKGLSVEEAIKLYKADPNVEYAEPNYIVTTQGISGGPGLQ